MVPLMCVNLLHLRITFFVRSCALFCSLSIAILRFVVCTLKFLLLLLIFNIFFLLCRRFFLLSFRFLSKKHSWILLNVDFLLHTQPTIKQKVTIKLQFTAHTRNGKIKWLIMFQHVSQFLISNFFPLQFLLWSQNE